MTLNILPMGNKHNSDQQNNCNENIPLKKFTIKHINIQSLNSTNKQENIKSYLISKNPDFLMLTETHISQKKQITQWIDADQTINEKYTITTDHIEDEHEEFIRSKGTAIIYNKYWDRFKQKEYKLPGRVTAMKFKRQRDIYLIACAYIPTVNSANMQEYRIVKRFIDDIIREQTPETKIIIGGDWNAVPNPQLDRNELSEIRSDQPGNTLIKQLLSPYTIPRMIDIWRLLHPTTIQFSHKVLSHTNGEPINESRIDYFLISANLISKVISTEIEQQLFEEQKYMHHDLISMNIRLDNPKEIHETKRYSNKDNAPCIDHALKTDEHVKQFNESLKKELMEKYVNMEVSDMNEQKETDMIYKIFHETLKDQITKHFPLKRQIANQKTINRHRRRQIFNKQWQTLLLAATKNMERTPLTDMEQVKIRSIYCKLFTEDNVPNDILIPELIKTCLSKIRLINRTLKKEHKEKCITERKRNFIKRQKQHINNIFEKKISWDGLQYIIDNVTHTVIEKPDEIKSRIKNFYQNIMTRENTNIVTTNIEQLQEEWKHEYEPMEWIDEEWYSQLKTPLEENEFIEIIRSLPNNKAPGPSGHTYDHYKILNDEDNINILIHLINHCMQHKILPTETYLASIILIPKKANWHGQEDHTRPLTLLETLRKIISLIITRRLTKIVDKRNILQGKNYGFRTGRSTSDALMIIRAAIDDAKHHKKELYIGNLDIKKAFDTVPYEAIIKGLKRIKAPESTIQMIITILTERDLVIDTPYGPTDTFRPNRGIPQGDSLSPLLWAIFYDPLLCKLEKETNGYKFSTDLKCSAVAYADDLTPISETKEDMQTQLDLITSFLTMYDMKMGANKSSVITNLAESHENSPKPGEFYLNNQPMQNIIYRNQLNRFLGVYWSLDGSFKKTYEHALASLKASIAIMNIKSVPGTIATHLLNTVIIPGISYKLLLIPINNTQAKTINGKLRQVTKRKRNLRSNTANEILYDKRYNNTNLQKIEETLNKKLITDVTAWALRDDFHINIIGHLAENATHKLKMPINILAKPSSLPSKSRSKNFIIYASTLMAKEGLSIQVTSTNYTQSNLGLFHSLTTEHYDYQAKRLYKFQLHKIETIQLPSNNKLMYDFSLWAHNYDSTHRTRFKDAVTTPDWYKTTQKYFTGTSTDDIYTKLPILPVFLQKNQTETNQELISTPDRLIDLWTDGSKLDNNRMGAGIIYTRHDGIEDHDIIGRQSYNVESNNISSTTGELWAILKGMQNIAPNHNVTIYTDSQAAKDAIFGTNELTTSVNPRNILKYKNHSILLAIHNERIRINGDIIIRKVKSHTNTHELRLNDKADELAKLGATYNEQPTAKLTYYNNAHPILIHLKDKPLDDYPSKYLKKKYQAREQAETDQTLERIHGSDIDIDITLKLTNDLIPKENHLDQTNNSTIAFRIQLINKKLATLDQVSKWNTHKHVSPICQRCELEVETHDHLFDCITTRDIQQDLKDITMEDFNTYLTDKCQLKEPIAKDYIKKITTAINFENTKFIQSPIAQGVITKDVMIKLKSVATSPSNFKSLKWKLLQFAHIWLTIFQKRIWKPRCHLAWETTKLKEQMNADNPTTSDNPTNEMDDSEEQQNPHSQSTNMSQTPDTQNVDEWILTQTTENTQTTINAQTTQKEAHNTQPGEQETSQLITIGSYNRTYNLRTRRKSKSPLTVTSPQLERQTAVEDSPTQKVKLKRRYTNTEQDENQESESTTTQIGKEGTEQETPHIAIMESHNNNYNLRPHRNKNSKSKSSMSKTTTHGDKQTPAELIKTQKHRYNTRSRNLTSAKSKRQKTHNNLGIKRQQEDEENSEISPPRKKKPPDIQMTDPYSP